MGRQFGPIAWIFLQEDSIELRHCWAKSELSGRVDTRPEQGSGPPVYSRTLRFLSISLHHRVACGICCAVIVLSGSGHCS